MQGQLPAPVLLLLTKKYIGLVSKYTHVLKCRPSAKEEMKEASWRLTTTPVYPSVLFFSSPHKSLSEPDTNPVLKH